VSGSRSVDTLGIAQRSPERPGRKCGSARIAWDRLHFVPTPQWQSRKCRLNH